MILDEYIINEDTIILEPAYAIDYATIVRERNNTFYVRQTPLQIIKKSCITYWGSYNGSCEAVLENAGFKKKVPVLVNREKQLCIFPTHAPKHIDCKWILCHQVKDILNDKITKGSIIKFYNGTSLAVSSSYYVVRKQYERALGCMLNMVCGDRVEV